MKFWRLWGGLVLLAGVLSGCGHNPNHDIDMARAEAAARRVHRPPDPGVKMGPGFGG